MIINAIIELTAAHTGKAPEELSADTTFESLGIDSLETVEMVMDLEDKLGYEIELTQKVATIGELAEYIRANYEA